MNRLFLTTLLFLVCGAAQAQISVMEYKAKPAFFASMFNDSATKDSLSMEAQVQLYIQGSD